MKSVVDAAEGSGAARGAATESGIGSKCSSRQGARSPRGYDPVMSLVCSHTEISSSFFIPLLFLERKIRDFGNVLERLLVAPEGREGSQNDPRGVLNNPPGGMFPENVRFSMNSRLKDVPKHIRFFWVFF